MPVDVPATTFAPRTMLLALVATVLGGTLSGTTMGVWLHFFDAPSGGGWTHDDATTVLGATGTGALLGLAAGVLTAIAGAWTAIALRRHIAMGRRRARLVLMLVTLVLWLIGVWAVSAALGLGGVSWFAVLLMLPGLLASLLTVWCGVPWVRRALDRRP